MPGGGLHLASSEARRRDGLLRRNLHYILTAIVAVVASVALAVPSVYADPANAGVDGSTQTVKAVSDAENRAGTGDNSWQIVKCGAENKDSEDCTRVSEDGNVRVHKWVTPTKTENVFDVHLSVDKRDDEISEVLNATALFGNSNKDIDYETLTKVCTGKCPIKQSPGGNWDFYYQIVFTDEAGVEHKSDVLHATELEQQVEAAFLMPGEFTDGDIVYVAWSGKRGVGSGAGTASDPAVLVVNTKTPGYGTVFGSVTKTISFGTDTSSAPVTDAMGGYILYEEGSALDGNASDGNSDVSFNSGNSTLSWTPVEKTGVEADDDGWLNNVAELQYKVTLDVTKDGFISSGFPTDDPDPVYDTNASATLNYTVTTTKKTGDNFTEEFQTANVAFQQPQVRGLLYDLVATKTDGSNMLNGATFGLYAADGETPVGKDGSEATEENPQYTVTSGQDDMAPGQIVFTGLPWGTYTVKEISAPDSYKSSDDTWTELLCYTTSRDGLVKSEVNNSHAMKKRSTAFINHKLTPVDPAKRKYVKDNGDGTYDLSLDVKGTIQTSQAAPTKIDIVYVLDTSYSMMWTMDRKWPGGGDNPKGDSERDDYSFERYNAATKAINTMNESLSSNTGLDVRSALVTFDYQTEKVIDFVSADQFSAMLPESQWSSFASGTNYAMALHDAKDVLEKADDGAQKVVIFISDGEPNRKYEDGETSDADADAGTKSAENQVRDLDADWFYVVGVGKDSYEQYLRRVADAANSVGNTGNRYYASDDSSELTGIFQDLAAQITSVDCSNVKITDTLSDYAEFAGTPTFRLTVTDGDGKVVADQSVDANGLVSFTAADGTTVTATVTYNLDDNSFNLVFPKEYVLDNGWTYTITTVIQPTDEARTEYQQNGYGDTKGDPDTDAEGNNTSSNMPGFWCNKEATLTYTSDGVQEVKPYDHPVIQVPVAVPGLVETKIVHGADAQASAFSFTVKPTGTDSDEAATIAGLATRSEENCKYENSTYTCTNPAIETDKSETVHTGNRLVFTTADIGKTYTYEYEETVSAAGWHSTGVNAWKVQIEVQKDEAKGGVKAVVTVFSRDSANGQFTQVSGSPFTYTDDKQTEKIQIGFENTFVSVSSLPLTGGRSTARTLLLSGGGVLLVAGAAWLLARRRQA